MAGTEFAQSEPAVSGAAKVLHRMANSPEHQLHLAFASLMDGEPHQAVPSSAVYGCDHRWCCHPPLEQNSPPESVEGGKRWVAMDQCLVGFVNHIAGMLDPLGEVAVVGQQEGPFGVEIEAANRENAGRDLWQKRDNRRSPLWVGESGDIAGRFVKEIGDQLVFPDNRAAIADDLLSHRVDLEARDGDHPAIDHHSAGGYHLFGTTAGTDAALGEILVEA
jgi:hypothetical protein